MINLTPKDISLDTGCDTNPSKRLGDDISAYLMLEVAFQESIGNNMLERVKTKRDYPIRIVDISDLIFGGSPEREIKLFPQLIKSLSCRPNRLTVKYFEWGRSLHQELDLRQLFHFEREVYGDVRYGAYREAETVTGRKTASMRIADMFNGHS